jgi:hypothetical protein
VKNPGTLAFRTTKLATAVLILGLCAAGQESGAASLPSGDASTADIHSEVRELRAIIEQMRTENAQSCAEMQELRQELQDTRKLLAPLAAANKLLPSTNSDSEQGGAYSSDVSTTTSESSSNSDLGGRVQKLEESTQLLGSKISEQYQTKVETAAKYRARLSGIVLMNVFHNVGNTQDLDLPNYAQPVNLGDPQANFGATLRQSEIGLEVFGPTVAGARTSANVQFDFGGGFPSTPNGVTFGIARMQTASLRLDWKRTSAIAGQDALFISPLSPTSFASLAIPTFAYAGNLWGWIPQVRVEHHFDLPNQQALTVQGGILDNLDWEPPYNSFYRSAQAGEYSGRPAYAVRTAWSRPALDHSLSIAAAAYYGRQNWSWNRYVDAWAGMADWQIPILHRLIFSGEFYRGRAVGGLGATIGRSVLFGGDPADPSTPIHGLDSAGGWAQLKFQLTPKLELNGVFAEDNAFASDVRGFAIDANNVTTILGRNRGALGNVVYRPRSDLVLSAEFRRLHTFPIYSNSSTANQINLAMGILF